MCGCHKILLFIYLFILWSCNYQGKKENSDERVEKILSYIYQYNCNICANKTVNKTGGEYSQNSIDSFIAECEINDPPILPSIKTYFYSKYINNVCLILEKNKLCQRGSMYYLVPESIDNKDGVILCQNDYFKNEKGLLNTRAATGVAINDSIIVTIKHASSFIDSLVFIFQDYIRFDRIIKDTVFIDPNNIYLAEPQDSICDSFDCIMFLKVKNVKIKKVVNIKIEKMDDSRKVFAMGYPLGTTLKIHTSGYAYFDSTQMSQVTTLNVYTHNSGSPVFDVKTNNLIGIVSNAPNCQIINRSGTCCYRSRNTCKRIGLSSFYRF